MAFILPKSPDSIMHRAESDRSRYAGAYNFHGAVGSNVVLFEFMDVIGQLLFRSKENL
jgi:hypothetical protein